MKIIIIFLKVLNRNLKAYFQPKSFSYIRHNSGYSSPNSYKVALKVTSERYSEDAPNNHEFRLNQLIEANPQLGNVAIDIGSGIGWLSGWLADFFHMVYSIEPSIEAINIAKKIHEKKCNKIIWYNGYSEEILPNLKFTDPVLFVTGRVLSHLSDREVKKIIKAVDNNSVSGSVICFTELWGETYHEKLWHIRSKNWWQTNFTDKWHLTFLENPVEIDGRYVGIHGVKVRS